jgi:CHASE3 domain sensor protein
MRWPSLQKIAISLPMAMLAALALVGINEAGFRRSHDALEHLAHSQSHTRIGQPAAAAACWTPRPATAATCSPATKATSNPTKQAVSDCQRQPDPAAQPGAQRSPEDLRTLRCSRARFRRKLSEMELSLRMRRKGKEDAWKFVLSTDVGKENMDAIRTHAVP